jgi:phosphoribosyl-ATP pyrophosphohydrolase
MKDMKVLNELYDVIEDRKKNKIEGSYTNYLFDKGLDKILKKVGEEATEVIIASKDGVKEDTIAEISDLLYHLIVLMSNEGITLEDISAELEKRSLKIGNKKDERKPIESI